jgi:hypothetical protein
MPAAMFSMGVLMTKSALKSYSVDDTVIGDVKSSWRNENCQGKLKYSKNRVPLPRCPLQNSHDDLDAAVATGDWLKHDITPPLTVCITYISLYVFIYL